MGQIFFIILALVISFKILERPGIQKIPWFLSAILFFPLTIVILPKPHMPLYRFEIYVLLLVTIIQYKHWNGLLSRFPLKYVMFFLFISLLCIGIFDFRIDPFLRIYRPINFFIENFFICAILYFYIKKPHDVVYLYKVIFKFFLVFSLYGVLNYVTRHNEFHTFISSVYGVRDFSNGNMVSGIDRFRISSFAWHAIYYGYLLAVVTLMALFMFLKVNLRPIEKTFLVVLVVLLLINLILVNSRTPLFALTMGITIYIIFATGIKQKIQVALIVTSSFLFALSYVPAVSKLFDESINTFSASGSSFEGSSVQMRERQFLASLAIFYKSPITGNGYSYITEGLGYSSDQNQRQTGTDLMGFESYVYKVLIEQGSLGIVGNIIFFIAIFIWLLKHYNQVTDFGKKLIVLTISILVTFLLFIIGTGDLGSFPWTLSIIGINMKAIHLSQKILIRNKNLVSISPQNITEDLNN